VEKEAEEGEEEEGEAVREGSFVTLYAILSVNYTGSCCSSSIS
jgi:hypothetical protein